MSEQFSQQALDVLTMLHACDVCGHDWRDHLVPGEWTRESDACERYQVKVQVGCWTEGVDCNCIARRPDAPAAP